MADALGAAVTALGVTASYYPQVLTGYDTATTVRAPSESAAVSVTGIFSNLRVRGPEDVISRDAQFVFPYSSTLGFTPNALDRVVIGAYSYRATDVKVKQVADTVVSYTLSLASN